MEHHLEVTDSRTGKSYKIPIEGDYIRAADVARIGSAESRDVAASKAASPLRIFDNGFQHTACMESSITHIDGMLGTIRYRDFPIETLFHEYDFEDVMHLLIWGQIPTQKQKDDVRELMAEAMVAPQTVKDVISAFPRDADTFPMLIAGMSAFTASDEVMCRARHQQSAVFHGHLAAADAALVRTLGYLAATIALVHRRKKWGAAGAAAVPDARRSLVGNLLGMMGTEEAGRAEACLAKLWILYADHEMTNSTAAALHAGSTLTDPASAVVAGVVSGYGPLHGGAIDLAYDAFRQVARPERAPHFVERVKAARGRLFGYGHRVYRTRDPRVALIEELLAQHRDAVEANPLLRVAAAIDAYASRDPYFVERGLKANADLLGCFLYTAMGFDTDMIIAITILSRAPGVLAHWRESLTQPVKLWRPQQKYVSPPAN
ncbi:putative citrate synthase [Durotheca rogersii]|uniref:putative citrate synthase n=1 Tax=Durotheca rogersii TaxID=419775 RepID=UPI00221F0229|nr:putative citrate synthase [Durotheca rogersii]KAI5863031.1 putative citrate synthase [Durotheca rogersii]